MVYKRVLENAGKAPDKAALIRPGAEEISYGQLKSHIMRARNYLAQAGVRPGEYVMLAASRSFSFVYAYLALHSLGAVAVPLDPQTPAARLEYISGLLSPKAGFWVSGGHGLADIAVFDRPGSDEPNGDEQVDAEMTADVMFTSGTTARPKGVRLTQGNLACAVNNINMFVGNGPADVEINPMPLSHSFGLARLRCTLYEGATQVMIDGVMRPKAVFKALEEYTATGLGLVAPAWTVLKRLSGEAIGRFRDQLRYLELGSAPMIAADKAHLAALLPTTRVCMHYGLTEASRAVFQEFHEPPETLSTVGRPSPLAEIKIFNELGEALPDGEIGEICVRGGMVTKGYLNADNETAFRDGYFRTGDLGCRRPDGYIVLSGRLKEMINVGGLKVSPLEVDQALAALPGITEAACIGVPDPMAGEVVAAFVVSAAGEPYTLEKMRKLLAGVLESHQMPCRLVYMDEIPKTPSGKVRRSQLKECLPA